MGQYLLSIVIPVYNGAQVIEQTLKQLIENDSFSKIQIILVNDGSKDNSECICESYANKYSNIKYANKENGGIASARNYGVAISDGYYVGFCDQDDFVEKDMYSRLLDRVKTLSPDLIMCGTYRYIDGDKVPSEVFVDKLYEKKEIFDGIVRPILFYGTTLGNAPEERWVGTVWKGLFKKDIITSNAIRFRSYVDFEDDLLFFIDYCFHCSSVVTCSFLGYGWRVNLNSETYNWKYIDGLDKRYDLYLSDVIGMMSTAGVDEYYKTQYSSFVVCKYLLKLLQSEGSTYNPHRFSERIKTIKDSYISCSSEAILFRKQINKTSIRTRVALDLLSHHMFSLAYLWHTYYKRFRERMIKRKLWFVIEKKIKQNWKR